MNISELLDAVKAELQGNTAINAIVSAVLSPEGTQLVADFVTGLAGLEAKHAADQAAAVEAARAVVALPPEPS